MNASDEGFVFESIKHGMRKPRMRFRLSSGRNVELIALHFEPGWKFGSDKAPQPIMRDVVARLYPNETPQLIDNLQEPSGLAFLCVAYFFSDAPVRRKGGNCSLLLTCMMMESIDHGVRNIVCDVLSRVDWEANATSDFLW